MPYFALDLLVVFVMLSTLEDYTIHTLLMTIVTMGTALEDNYHWYGTYDKQCKLYGKRIGHEYCCCKHKIILHS